MDTQPDVVRIRLWNAQNATVFVSEFHKAERVLEEWGSLPGRRPVGFEIRFVDGAVVEGAHELFRNGKRRCLLATHVRRLLCAAPAGSS
jgi:hypothetical protein